MRVHGRRDGRQRAYLLAIAALTILSASLSTLVALSTPYFDGPDEVNHFNSVTRLVAGGGWPEPYNAYRLPAVLTAESQATDPVGTSGTPLSADQRSNLLGAAATPDDGVDNMVQHPPLYYFLVGLPLRALGLDTRWDHALLIVRATSAWLMAAAVPFLVGISRWLTGSRAVAVVGGVGFLSIPFLTVSGGYVSNDALLITTVSATVYLLVRASAAVEDTWWCLPTAGLAYGAALLTKGFALMLAPTVLILAMTAWWRAPAPRRAGVARATGVAAVLSLGVGGWWWLKNLIVDGRLQPTMAGTRTHRDSAIPGYDLGAFAVTVTRRLVATFWGRGAREGVALPWSFVLVLTALTIAVLAVALLERSRRGAMLALSLYPALITATIVANARAIYWDTGDMVRGIQGRYVFSAISLLTTAWAITATRVHRHHPATVRVALPVSLVVVALIQAIGTGWTVEHSWTVFVGKHGFSSALERSTYMGVPGLVLVGIGAVLVTAIVVVLGAGDHLARSVQPSRPQRPQTPVLPNQVR